MTDSSVPGVARRGARAERLGIVSYANVSPLHHDLEAWDDGDSRLEFVYGVPSELNRKLLIGEIDLTLISSIEFLRQRERLRALPDFSIATLGPVYSVMLFHWLPWHELNGARIAVTTESATSVELLRVLLAADGASAELCPMPPDLDRMMAECDAALLIGDAALVEGVARRPLAAGRPLVSDLGEAWYRLTRLPFTFAVWAALRENPPSPRLVDHIRGARQRGLARIGDVAGRQARERNVPVAAMERYLSNFRYYLDLPDRDGLHEFGSRSISGFVPGELEYWDL